MSTSAGRGKVLVLDEAARRRAKQKRDALVEAHTEVVWILARRLIKRCPDTVELMELVSIGNLALLESAARYNARTGVPFEAYARPRIKGAMLDSMRGRNYTAVTAHDPIDSATEPTHDPLSEMPERIDRDRERERVRAAVASLPPEERIVVERRFYSSAEPTLEKVAEETGIGRTRTTVLLRNALRRIRIEVETEAQSA